MTERGPFKLYNTLSRKLEEFVGRKPGKAGIYCCGPTVYDVPHAGHARAAVAFDVLVRHLRARGLEVTYVRNVTDIDDKILARAKDNGEAPLELSRRMEAIYRERMATVGCLAPDREPRVSEHLDEVVALVEQLIAAGRGYVCEMPGGTRDVYFSVRSFPGYGKLSRRRIDELMVGARVARDEAKQDPLDFALWKGVPDDEWGWPSPWGRGRPGWHIECSAMSTAYLGYGFDIHAGGMDLIFPHHENEIAQSEGAHAAHAGEEPWVHYWMHNGFVNVDKEKMGKSLGNFVTVDDVLARNDAEAFRWFLLTVQYRGPIQFDTEKVEDGRVIFPGIDEAESRVDYVYATMERLRELVEMGVTVPMKVAPELLQQKEAVERAILEAGAALDDDLNTPVALAVLGELARIGNEICDVAQKRRKDAAFVGAAALAARAAAKGIEQVARELGLLQATPAEHRARCTARRLGLRGLDEATVQAKVDQRTAARRAKDFARSDAIRNELAAVGVTVRDGPAGTEWTIAP
ncbi:MAG: cysteine--tRNA ligase [Polyangiaceae bacterium]|nr:cysteine--tRNA ligase [Polyangiaceae bacterium]